MINNIIFYLPMGVAHVRIPNRYETFDIHAFYNDLLFNIKQFNMRPVVRTRLLASIKVIDCLQIKPALAVELQRFIAIIQNTLNKHLTDPSDRLFEYNQDWSHDVTTTLQNMIEQYGEQVLLPAPTSFLELGVYDRTDEEDTKQYKVFQIDESKCDAVGSVILALQTNYDLELYSLQNYGTIAIIDGVEDAARFMQEYANGLNEYLTPYMDNVAFYADSIRETIREQEENKDE